ncbi:MAG: ABC transporter permease [Candidatus Baltobacteraceae bacterium]
MNEFVTVFSAEVMRRLKSRSFLIGLMIGAVGILVMLRLPSYMDSFANDSYKVVLAGDSATIAAARPLLGKDFNITAMRPGLVAPTERDIDDDGRASAVIVLTRAPRGIRVVVYARDPGSVSAVKLRRDLLPLHAALATNLSLKQVSDLIRMPVTVRPLGSKFGTAQQAEQARGVAYVLLFVLYLLIVLNSQLIMTSVAEEKTSRIAELLVASVDPRALLAGKIAASALLAIVQMAVWIAVGFIAGSHASIAAGAERGADAASFATAGIAPADIAVFGVFFLMGYLQMAVMFAAIGSLINRTEDIGSIGGPFFIPVIAALIIATTALSVPDAPVVIVTSFVPLIAPFVMFARLVVSSVPVWQIALSFAINAAAIYFFAILGGKIYRIGMLLYGRPPKLMQLLRALRG